MPTAKPRADYQASALHKQGHTEAALSLLEQAIKRHPNQGPPWLVRAITLHCQIQWAHALADVETAMTPMLLPIGGQLVLADCYAHHRRSK